MRTCMLQRFPTDLLKVGSTYYLEEGARAWQRLSAHISETTVNVNVDLRRDSRYSEFGNISAMTRSKALDKKLALPTKLPSV